MLNPAVVKSPYRTDGDNGSKGEKRAITGIAQKRRCVCQSLLLVPAYNWFAEAVDTVDSKEDRSALKKLR